MRGGSNGGCSRPNEEPLPPTPPCLTAVHCYERSAAQVRSTLGQLSLTRPESPPAHAPPPSCSSTGQSSSAPTLWGPTATPGPPSTWSRAPQGLSLTSSSSGSSRSPRCAGGAAGACAGVSCMAAPSPLLCASQWSEVRSELYYGFGRMGFSAGPGAFSLAYDFVDKDGTVRDHFSIVKTRKQQH